MAARKKTTADGDAAPKKAPKSKAPKKAVQRHLTKELGQLLAKTLLPDLRERAKSGSIREGLVAQWETERAAKRTGDDVDAWIDRWIEQVGVAWILSCAFLRTLEDRGFLTHNRLAGEGAQDAEHLFFDLFPSLGLRDYLLATFRELSHLPGGKEVLGPQHNPAWRLAPSGDALRALVGFFREAGEDGQLVWRFRRSDRGGETTDGPGDGIGDTRFLGDLYQDVSEAVRERYALLQTPVFVEEFILDLTLEPAIAEYGLETVRLIDPTCGSGHFLLGAFRRLFDQHQAAAPGLSRKELAGKAIAQVYGVDLNPFAAAIARFRLVLAYLEAAGFEKLKEAPELPTNVIVADSLLHTGKGQKRFDQVEGQERNTAAWGTELFELEDPREAERVFGQEYHAVVGNPPYITCKDPVLREKYREAYVSAAGKYALAAPFTERFFTLAVPGGFVGLINANSFMKREFGKKLIEEVLKNLELTHVFDTSGAYIPGHGTPTVLLFGRNRRPLAATVRAVLGKRGEPSTPEDAAKGLVWSDIAGRWREVGFDSDYVSVVDAQRATFDAHPWSLGGGGAAELKELLEARAEKRLDDIVDSIGFMAITAEDEAYISDASDGRRHGLRMRPFAVGELLRDWGASDELKILCPYDDSWRPVLDRASLKRLWPYRPGLSVRLMFGKTQLQAGLEWFEYRHLGRDKIRNPLSIGFAFVATHNHFVLDRGDKVFNRTSPIIKLPEGATEEDHLALLAYLNSSTACFWMKQVFMNKGATSDRGVLQADPAKFRFEFDGTKLKLLPIPQALSLFRDGALVALARELDSIGRTLGSDELREALEESEEATVLKRLHGVISSREERRARMVRLQEELDWTVYSLLELVPVASAFQEEGVPVAADERAFLTEQTPHRVRRALIDATPQLQLIERPEFKRRWFRAAGVFDAENLDDTMLAVRVAKDVIGDALESAFTDPAPRRSSDLVTAAGRARGVQASLTLAGPERDRLGPSLLDAESIPYLAALRYSEAGLEKRAKWEETWALQRREDAGEKLTITVPPKYDAKDFRDPNYFRIRGKLDVPKERFISYPGAEKDDDKSPLYGWAGWDHLQQATALAALYHERKTEDGWPADRLVPLLAGLLELVPWLKQWHNEKSDDFGGEGAGDWYERYAEGEARGLGKGVEELRGWRPGKARKGVVRDAPVLPLTARGRSSRAANEAGAEAPTGSATASPGTSLLAPPPAWDEFVIAAAGLRAGVEPGRGAWAYSPTGENAAYAALFAVLRQAGAPTSRANVELAVVLTLVPRLLREELGDAAKLLREAVGEENWKVTSVESLALPWRLVVRRAKEDGYVLDSGGEWSAGDGAAEMSDPALEARASVALAWLNSASATPALREKIEREVRALDAA